MARFREWTDLLGFGGARALGLAILATCLLVAFVAVAAPAGAEASSLFSRLSAEMTEKRDGPAAASLPDGKVLILGGYSGSEFLKSAEVFDPTTGTFEKLPAEMVEARYEPVVAALPDGDLLISGGNNASSSIRTAELFDPTTKTFESLSAETVDEREGAVAMALPDGKVLIAGGYKSSGTVDTAELFNPTSKTFESLPAVMTKPRFIADAAVLPDGKLLITGGVNSQNGVMSEHLSSAEVFNPSTEGFESLDGEMAEPREGASAASLPDGKVLIVGGTEADQSGQTAEVFDPSTMTFEKLAAEIAGERTSSVAVSLPDGDVLIAGGDTNFGPPLRTAELASGSAALVPSFIWSGGSEALSESSFDWSRATNWRGGAIPATDEATGTLTFPHLSNGTCTSKSPTDTCYEALNDVIGLSAESMQLDDGDDYELFGEELELGSGGLTAAPANGSSGSAGDILELPIALTAQQTWSIDGRSGGALGENGIALEGDLTGSASALTFEIGNEALAVLANNTEVGPVAIDGANASKAGILNGFVELFGADLNSTDGNPVSLNHIFVVGDGALGPLSTDEAELIVEDRVTTRSATFDAGSDVGFEIYDAGATAGTDYSQLSSAGAVVLGGSKLLVHVPQSPKKIESEPEPPCPSLTPGQKYTFLSTTGTLSESFANAPEGTEIAISFAKTCSQTSEKMRIAYSRSGGTETVTGTVEATAKEAQEAKEGQEAKERQEAKEKEEALKNPPKIFESPQPAPITGNVEAASREATARAAQERAIRETGERAGREAAAKEEAAAKKKLEEKAKASTKPLTRAQLLAKALKTCKKQPKKKRAQCEATAKKRYGPRKKTKK